jgi:hypothetical protein
MADANLCTFWLQQKIAPFICDEVGIVMLNLFQQPRYTFYG